MKLDHLVIGTPDLGAAIAQMTDLAAVTASPGGRHPNWGTHNALLGLDESSYIELLGPVDRRRRNARLLAGLEGLSLVWWCAPATPQVLALKPRIVEGERELVTGSSLRWRILTLEGRHPLLPFFIDWGSSPHPAGAAPSGVQLSSFILQTPAPQRLLGDLRAVGIAGAVIERTESDGYRATLSGGAGRFEVSGRPLGMRW